jgi:hypothetical protein
VLSVSIRKVKPQEVGTLTDWMAQVRLRIEKVRETFRREGVRHEQAFLLRTSDGPVLIYAVEAQDHEKATALFEESALPIDLEHRAVMARVLGATPDVELLLDCSA